MSNGDSAVLKALEQCRARLRDESFRMSEVSHSFLLSKGTESFNNVQFGDNGICLSGLIRCFTVL